MYQVEQDGIAEAEQVMDALGRQGPFVVARTLTLSTKDAQQAIRKEMGRRFDQPTPYTLRALRIKPATKRNPSAYVWVKDRLEAGKGTAPENYLLPQVEGGARKHKRHEKALQRMGILPQGWYTVPAKGAPVDRFGNLQRSEYVRILSWFQAFGEQGYRANSTAKTRDRKKRGTKKRRGQAYFAITPRSPSALQPGIYRRERFAFGWGIKPVLIFTPSVSYGRRLDFYGVARKTTERVLGDHFRDSIQLAMRTAR